MSYWTQCKIVRAKRAEIFFQMNKIIEKHEHFLEYSNISLTKNGYFPVPWKRISIRIWYFVPSHFLIEYPENFLQNFLILYPTSFPENGYISGIFYPWIFILIKSDGSIFYTLRGLGARNFYLVILASVVTLHTHSGKTYTY